MQIPETNSMRPLQGLRRLVMRLWRRRRACSAGHRTCRPSKVNLTPGAPASRVWFSELGPHEVITGRVP